MANKKITELSNLTTPNGADVLAIVDDIAGTATTKKVTATNLMTLAPVQSVAGRTGTVTLSNTDISGLGTAATQDVGTSANNVVQLNGSGALPAVDGSNLTNVGAGDLLAANNLSDVANAGTSRTNLGLGTAATTASSDYATSAQGTLADSATQPGDNISTLTNDSNFIDSSGAPVQSVAGRTGTVTVDAGDLTDGNFDGTAILGFDASINDQTGTAYTLLAGDNGKVVVLNNGSAVTVTVPGGLGAGFNCSFVQKGAGQVSFDNDSGATTINNRQSHTKINAQYGVASIVAYADNVFVLAGDTAS